MARAESLKAAYEKQGIPSAELNKRLEFVIVDDLSSEEQWTGAFEDVDGVLHAVLSFPDIPDHQLIPDAVIATLSLLQAAKKFPSIKRVVIVSSIVASITPPLLYDTVHSAEDWNDDVLKMFPVDHDPIWKRTSGYFPYSVAKLKAEPGSLSESMRLVLMVIILPHVTDRNIHVRPHLTWWPHCRG
jgi:nucleoside-diphosphate-sugar epimerase